MRRTIRFGIVAAAVALSGGLASCVPPSGGGGTGGPTPVTGCFDSIGVGSYRIKNVGSNYYINGFGTRGCVPDGTPVDIQVWRNGNQLSADALCRGELNSSTATAQYVGVLLVPAQPEVFRCVG